MTENEKINGWTFEETIKTVENVMEVENNMFKWDVLRHLRDFTEIFKYELEQCRAIGTVEEFKALKEKSVAKKTLHNGANWYRCPNGCEIHKKQFEKDWYCPKCGQKLDWE